jgi:hypothetical protein
VARLNDALPDFYRSAHTQLRAPDPEGVIDDDDLDNMAQNPRLSLGPSARPSPDTRRWSSTILIAEERN